jgi:hypothetical protein
LPERDEASSFMPSEMPTENSAEPNSAPTIRSMMCLETPDSDRTSRISTPHALVRGSEDEAGIFLTMTLSSEPREEISTGKLSVVTQRAAIL